MSRVCTIVLLMAGMLTPLLADNTMTVTSPSFDEGKPIPGRFAYHSENHPPSLTFSKPHKGQNPWQSSLTILTLPQDSGLIG
jgi:phosphatidylethanolamine-binding protein (PEBP) family uncharacterized protein